MMQIPNGTVAYVTTNEGYRITTTFVPGKKCVTFYTVIAPDGREIKRGKFPSHLREPSFGDLDHAWEISEKEMRQDMAAGKRSPAAARNIKPTGSAKEPKLKKYAVYFENDPYDAMTCMAKNKTEARQIGNLYNRQWDLHTKILRIEEVQ